MEPKYPSDLPPPSAHPPPKLRRQGGGARVNLSGRVSVVCDGEEQEGWVLNLSKGGLRIILEGDLNQDAEVAVDGVGASEPALMARTARVVWVRKEPDGVIAGLAFTDGRNLSVSPPPVIEAPAVSAEPSASEPSLPIPEPTITASEPSLPLPEPTISASEPRLPIPEPTITASEPPEIDESS